MAGYFSTGQSPQWAVVLMEEDIQNDFCIAHFKNNDRPKTASNYKVICDLEAYHTVFNSPIFRFVTESLLKKQNQGLLQVIYVPAI
jgi:hypothetical protein